MRFQMPQFIEVEDKIFGPLTFKQFLYLVGGVGLSVVFFLFLPWYIALIPVALVMGFSAAMAFYKINNKPLVYILEAGAKYIYNSKLYVWRKVEPPIEEAEQPKVLANTGLFVPKLSNSKLKDLAWSLDAKQSLNPATKDDGTMAG
jgi:hypothetical protein